MLVKQNNVEKDAATQRISRTQVRQKRKHVQTSLLVNRLHHLFFVGSNPTVA